MRCLIFEVDFEKPANLVQLLSDDSNNLKALSFYFICEVLHLPKWCLWSLGNTNQWWRILNHEGMWHMSVTLWTSGLSRSTLYWGKIWDSTRSMSGKLGFHSTTLLSCLSDAPISLAFKNRTHFYLDTVLPAKILHIPSSFEVLCRLECFVHKIWMEISFMN